MLPYLLALLYILVQQYILLQPCKLLHSIQVNLTLRNKNYRNRRDIQGTQRLPKVPKGSQALSGASSGRARGSVYGKEKGIHIKMMSDAVFQ